MNYFCRLCSKCEADTDAIALGDNIYSAGVSVEPETRIAETFEDVYTGQYLQNNWYVIAGNHDHNGRKLIL